MDFPQKETKGKKIALAVLIFLFALALGIIGVRLYLQNKVEKNQKQIESSQEPNSTIPPALPNAKEPSNLPDTVPLTNDEKIPPPPNVTEPSKSPDITPPSDKEEIPVPPNVTEPSRLPDIPPSSKDGKMPPPLP